jgi:hypothetical protein
MKFEMKHRRVYTNVEYIILSQKDGKATAEERDTRET